VAGYLGAFPYTPVAARAFAPASLLSWVDFWFLWMALLVGTAIWLGGRRALLILAFPPVAADLYHGNVHLLIAAAVALGFRYPAAWAFILLTKVTPGIGLVWFAVRREWPARDRLALQASSSRSRWSCPAWSVVQRAILPAAGRPAAQRSAAGTVPMALVVVAGGRARTARMPVAVTLALPILWFAGL
jgi:hypothetical protein